MFLLCADDSPGKRQCKEALDKKSSNIDSQEVVVTLKASVKENRNGNFSNIIHGIKNNFRLHQ